jgi:cellulose synthase/poly-beta-1,6-N-acetylglucosamine synthase-like glycosyltransferase
MLEFLAIALAGIHFGIPLAYYWYAKTKWLPKPWNVRIDESYSPTVTVIVPTYNEAELIEKRLENLYLQDYPKDLREVVIIDSGNDGTAELVENWYSTHRGLSLKLIRESERRGKVHALNRALKHCTSNIVVTADADALWPKEALRGALKWFADQTVGAVSCLKKSVRSGFVGVEEGYREYYNVLRVAESKAYATPIFHGELAAFRRDCLEKISGFPTDIGADDSHTATRIALMGYRAIIPEDLWVEEYVPNRGYFWWKVRRAQHLIQHFRKALKTKSKMDGAFKRIMAFESFLHLVNPWILFVATLLFIISVVMFHSLLAIAFLMAGLALFGVKRYRVWIMHQLYLVVAVVRSLWTKEIVWKKQAK